MTRRGAVLATVIGVLAAGLGGWATAGATHGPVIRWSAVRNPILSEPHHAVKDQAVVWEGGRWHAVFSREDAAGRWRIGLRTSADLSRWSRTRLMPHDPAVAGEASPDVERAPDGRFVVAYQSFPADRRGARPKLYYRSTRDFLRFSPPHRLAPQLFTAPQERLIDAALAWTPAGLLLGFKRGTDEQHFELARSTSGTLRGPWELVGAPDIQIRGDTVENYQLVHLRGGWQLLATTNNGNHPVRFALAGDPARPEGWLHWGPGQELAVPQEAWNAGRGLTGSDYEHANCAYLADGRAIGGWYYLTYSDAPEKTTFGGEGHAVVAIARSRDLVHWSVPPS